MSKGRIAITGLGVVTAAGSELDAFWSTLHARRVHDQTAQAVFFP